MVDVLALVRAVVPDLRLRNGRWWGRCPFHGERTPSFTVRPDVRRFHCFGCNASGDAIDFVARIRGVSLGEAIGALAHEYGIADAPRPAPSAPIPAESLPLDWQQARAREEFETLAMRHHAAHQRAHVAGLRLSAAGPDSDDAWRLSALASIGLDESRFALVGFFSHPGFLSRDEFRYRALRSDEGVWESIPPHEWRCHGLFRAPSCETKSERDGRLEWLPSVRPSRFDPDFAARVDAMAAVISEAWA